MCQGEAEKLSNSSEHCQVRKVASLLAQALRSIASCYSPNIVEVEFCELRVDGVLRRSTSENTTSRYYIPASRRREGPRLCRRGAFTILAMWRRALKAS